jgi:RimJ/RimL family protein N-acetyltransferase
MADHHAGEQDFGSAAGPAAHHAQWRGAVRELRTSQLYHYQWHLLRLDDGWRRLRFGGPTSDASQCAFGERVDSIDTVVLGCFVNGQMRGAAEFRSHQRDKSDGTEIVFSVESAWQERGIGTALMAAAICAARERGITHLYLSCHALNHRMQRIAERFAAKIDFEGCGCFAEITVCEEPVASG